MVNEKPLPWMEWLEALFRRRRWILAGTALGLSYALISIWAQPELYRAKARILLTAQAVPNVRDAAMPVRQITAEIALMKSPKLVRSVLENRGVITEVQSPESTNPIHGIARKVFPRSRSLDSRAVSLSRRIIAEPVQGTNLVDVAMVDEDPVWAADFVNDLLQHHVQRIGDMGDQPQAQGFYGEQRDLLAERWRQARANLSAFRARQGDSALSGGSEHLMGVVTGLENQLVAAQTQALELEARARYLREEIQRHPKLVASESRVTKDDSVGMLQNRLLELEIERSELLSRYTPESTLVRDLDRRIEEARRLLQSKEGDTLSEELTSINPSFQALEVDIVQTEASLTAARARVEALLSQGGRYRTQLASVEDVSAELERLQAEVTSAQEAYNNYTRQQEAARFNSAISESGIVNVSIVEAAEVPTSSEPSRSRVVLGFWTLVGLVAGTLLAVVRDLLDPTVQSSRRTARVTELPVIAEIPSV
ncbi:MAG TPA: hypothetical protein VMT85_14800 [Thermoanaerobaculia bacterium]|nr:hypothetical protein [Thermoanaerobaculia bacterium]